MFGKLQYDERVGYARPNSFLMYISNLSRLEILSVCGLRFDFCTIWVTTKQDVLCRNILSPGLHKYFNLLINQKYQHHHTQEDTVWISTIFHNYIQFVFSPFQSVVFSDISAWICNNFWDWCFIWTLWKTIYLNLQYPSA